MNVLGIITKKVQRLCKLLQIDDDTENNTIINSKTVFIQSDEQNVEQNTEIIKHKIAAKLNFENFISQKNINNANYKITIEAKINKKNNAYGVYFCWVKASVVVINSENNILFQKDFTPEKGSSVSSYKEAAEKAYNIIADKIANEVLNSIK